MPTEIVDDPFAICKDPEHRPPHHIVIPPGKMIKHTCPSCGKVTTVRDTGPFWEKPPTIPCSPPWVEPYPPPNIWRTDPDCPPWERPIVRFYVGD